MCHNVLKVVKIDESRYVGVCPHGTVHIGWDRVTVYLEDHELRTLAQTLQESFLEEILEEEDAYTLQVGLGLTAEEMAELAAEEEEFDEEEEDWEEIEDSVQVWLGEVSLLLTMDDFQSFMDMILDAYDLLVHDNEPRNMGQGSDTDIFFSLN